MKVFVADVNRHRSSSRSVQRFFAGLFAIVFLQLLSVSAIAQTYVGTTVGQHGDGIGLSFALAPGDVPAASFFNEFDKVLRYGTLNGQNWQTEVVDSTLGNTSQTALVYLSGNPHIIYYSASQARLKHAFRSGTTWTTQVITASGNSSNSLRATLCGTAICVSYYDSVNRDLRFAKYSGGIWTASTVDSTTDDVGSESAIASTSAGLAVISYYDATNKRLKVATQQAGGTFTSEVINLFNEAMGVSPSVVIAPSGAVTVSCAMVKGSTPPHDLGIFLATKPAGGTWSFSKILSEYSGGTTDLSVLPSGLVGMATRFRRANPNIGNYSAAMFASLDASGNWNREYFAGDLGPLDLYYSFESVAARFSSGGSRALAYRFVQNTGLGLAPMNKIRIHQPLAWAERSGPIATPTPTPSPDPTPNPTTNPTPTLPPTGTPTPDPREGDPDSFNRDSDGDGISDGQELLDGTNPFDRGSFLPKPGVVSCQYWSHNQNETSYVIELMNLSVAARVGVSSVKDGKGKTLGTRSCTVDVGSQCNITITDLILKTTSRSGTVCISHNGNPGDIEGQLVVSRPTTKRRHGRETITSTAFSKTTPLSSGALGTQSVSLNTSTGTGISAASDVSMTQSVFVANPGTVASEGTIAAYDVNGTLVKSMRVRVGARGRAEVTSGQLAGVSAGSVSWIPDDATKSFVFGSERNAFYGKKSKKVLSNSAAFLGGPGTGEALHAALDTRGRQVFVELVNSSTNANSVLLKATNNAGEQKFIQTIDIAPKGTVILEGITILGGADIGSITAQGSQNNGLLLFVSSSIVKKDSRRESAFILSGRESTSVQYHAAFDTRSKVSSKVVLSNISDLAESVTLTLSPKSQVVDKLKKKKAKYLRNSVLATIQLAPHQTIEVDVASLGSGRRFGYLAAYSENSDSIAGYVVRKSGATVAADSFR